MRRQLLVVSEKIKTLKTAILTIKKSSIIGGATITFCAQTTHITNICKKLGLIIFNTLAGLIIFNNLAVTLLTDDTGCRMQDTGRVTLSPTTPYCKLSRELKTQ